MGNSQAAMDYRLLAPRDTLAGSSGQALGNLIVDQYPDGALCWVTAESALYELAKFSTEALDGTRVIATSRGAGHPGRWIAVSGAGGVAAMETLIWCDEHFTGTPTGSISAPFPTLQQAIDVVPDDGASILMAVGEYLDPWSIPAGATINIFGIAASQGKPDGNVELGSGSIGTGAGVRFDNVAFGEQGGDEGHITLSGSGSLYCSNVSFYIHDLIQSGAGGWNIRIVCDGIEVSDVGNVTAELLVGQNVTFQRPIHISGQFGSKLLYCTPQEDITFTGSPGVLITDLFTLNVFRAQGGDLVNGVASAVDAPSYQLTIASPVFGAAGIQTVAVSAPGSKIGDTFTVSNKTALPAGVALGQPICTSDDSVSIVLFAFAAASGGNVDISLTRFNGGL